MPPPIESAYSLMNAFMTKDKGKVKKLLVSWGNSRDQQRTNIFQVTLNPCREVDEKHVRHTGCQ